MWCVFVCLLFLLFSVQCNIMKIICTKFNIRYSTITGYSDLWHHKRSSSWWLSFPERCQYPWTIKDKKSKFENTKENSNSPQTAARWFCLCWCIQTSVHPCVNSCYWCVSISSSHPHILLKNKHFATFMLPLSGSEVSVCEVRGTWAQERQHLNVSICMLAQPLIRPGPHATQMKWSGGV